MKSTPQIGLSRLLTEVYGRKEKTDRSWKTSEQRKFLDNLATEFNFKTWEDWYQINSQIIKDRGGAGLMTLYNGSTMQLLSSHFPQHPWKPWRFKRVPRNFWSDKNNQKLFLEDISTTRHFATLDDLYSLHSSDIHDHGGSGLLELYDNLPSKIIKAVYPQHNWLDWMFHQHPGGYWKQVNHREFMDNISKLFRIEKWQDWYQINQRHFFSIGAGGLLKHYNSSPFLLITSVYKEHPWEPWMFQSVEKGFYQNDKNLKACLEWAAKKLGVNKLEDWNNISVNQIRSLGLQTMLINCGGLQALLMKFYPDFRWDFRARMQHKSKSQRVLFDCVKELFDSQDIHLDYQHQELTYQTSGHTMELDIYLPSLSLAFEYQGEQHYERFSKIQMRDEEKRIACKKHNITLVEVPFWWDLTRSSLQATIHRHRPDLIDAGDGIPIAQTSSLIHRKKSEGLELLEKGSYVVSLGPKSGTFPKCKGCGELLQDRSLPRVRVQTDYSTFTFCLKSSCINNGISESKSHNLYYPNFDGTVHVLKKFKLKEELIKNYGKDLKFVFHD